MKNLIFATFFWFVSLGFLNAQEVDTLTSLQSYYLENKKVHEGFIEFIKKEAKRIPGENVREKIRFDAFIYGKKFQDSIKTVYYEVDYDYYSNRPELNELIIIKWYFHNPAIVDSSSFVKFTVEGKTILDKVEYIYEDSGHKNDVSDRKLSDFSQEEQLNIVKKFTNLLKEIMYAQGVWWRF